MDLLSRMTDFFPVVKRRVFVGSSHGAGGGGSGDVLGGGGGCDSTGGGDEGELPESPDGGGVGEEEPAPSAIHHPPFSLIQ